MKKLTVLLIIIVFFGMGWITNDSQTGDNRAICPRAVCNCNVPEQNISCPVCNITKSEQACKTMIEQIKEKKKEVQAIESAIDEWERKTI